MTNWVQVSGTVMRGHGVASGKGGDPRFPGGTIGMQRPAFAAHGLMLDAYFPGTLNISIAPHRYRVRRAKHTFRQVKWADNAPAEDFSFFDCRIVLGTGQRINGLIYYPHPETKPEHFQEPDTLEVLAKFMEGVTYGLQVRLELDPEQLWIVTNGDTGLNHG